tara:strand:+ start:3819 stop:4133 length:315 start_codon:yes stop_codon:yes gene_type:complete
MLSLLFLLACEDTPIAQSVEIPSEAYEWSCLDYTEHTEIEITAAVCNEFESMTVSILLINEQFVEQEMRHEGGCWWYSLISQDQNCIQVHDIIITAQTGDSNGR